jgi:hypothetical protein
MLRAGMENHESTGKLYTLSKSAKRSILKKLVVDIFNIKSYPTEEECGLVAKSLMSKFPCLRDPGTASGSYGWRNSIVFKMGSYRNDLRESGRRSSHRQDPPGGHKTIKKARRAESNYLPDLPGNGPLSPGSPIPRFPYPWFLQPVIDHSRGREKRGSIREKKRWREGTERR